PHPLDEAGRRADPLAGEQSWRWLHGRLTALNRLGKFNCLLSDGRRLFCYHDAAAYKGLVFRAVSLREGTARRFEDSTMQLKPDAGAVNHGFVVATCPLSTTGWHSFHAGELLVVEEGQVRFSSHRAAEAPAFAVAGGKEGEETGS